VNSVKKLSILGLILILLCSCGVVTWGSTIGVNVSEGASVTVEKENFDLDSFKLTGNFGVNDQLLLWVGYSTETAKDSDDATPSLGLRYEFVNNFAGIFGYRTQEKLDELAFGVRAKTLLSKPLTLIGEAKYHDFIPEEGDSFTGYSLKAQLEYSITPLVTGNLGGAFFDTESEDSESSTYILAGLEFYPTEQFTWWVDYSRDQDNDENIVGAGIEYKF
jgi:hypothetical protein